MNNKSIKLYIIPFIAVAVFSLLLFGAGYAYFSSTLTMNSANYAINMPMTTSLVCTKQDCNVTITPDMMTNTNTNATVAKGTSNCSVSCTCSGTPGAVCAYDVKLLESGTEYTPSTGLSTNKEFTVKVTLQSGCTAQNSSSTETQVNTLRNKVVSSCSLTVPQGGNITSNVYAEFKWYNLNLDQTSHANAVYNYQLTNDDGNSSSGGFTGTIYRNTTDTIINGESIESHLSDDYCVTRYDHICVDDGSHYDSTSECYSMDILFDPTQWEGDDEYDPNEYYTCEKYYRGLRNGYTNSSSGDIYLKHNVVNGIVQASYVCLNYNSIESCFQGGNPSYYGTYNGMSSAQASTVINSSGNIKKLHDLGWEQEYVGWDGDDETYYTWSYNNSKSLCYDDGRDYWSYNVEVGSNGSVKVSNSTYGCYITSSSNAYCDPLP